MLKSKFGTPLALAVLVALAGCSKKEPAADAAKAPDVPAAAAPAQMPADHPAARPSVEVDLTGIAKAEGGKTVAEVFAEKDALAGKQVTVRGKAFTFLALATGSIWGKPMWGTWWVWDARLTSELLLLFLYLGYMALRASFDDPQRADRASAVLALVGVINVPIIHYSVEWWSTLHQPASVTKFDKPSIDLAMLIPLFIMIVGFQLYFGWAVSRRLRGEILRRERNANWLKEAT